MCANCQLQMKGGSAKARLYCMFSYLSGPFAACVLCPRANHRPSLNPPPAVIIKLNVRRCEFPAVGAVVGAAASQQQVVGSTLSDSWALCGISVLSPRCLALIHRREFSVISPMMGEPMVGWQHVQGVARLQNRLHPLPLSGINARKWLESYV